MENVSRRREHLQTSPERNKVWNEPAPHVTRIKRVSVVYYLSRNGHLEHPHFMEVPLSCPDGLYLKDVMNRLNLLRGKGLTSMYSWSSKRSYKNGFVWQDLSEDDYIHPVHGVEYVLKGSEVQGGKCEEDDSPMIMSRGNAQHWSSGRLHECKVYNTESARETYVSTQTGETENENHIVEVEGSPPPVDSSPETLESLMKADKSVMVVTTDINTKTNSNEGNMQSGQLKASSVLMQLITCGSFSFRHSGTTTTPTTTTNGVKLITNQHKAEENSQVETKEVEGEHHSPSFEGVRLEDKEYYSGSVMEKKTNQMKEDEFPSLKRSSSYNADRVSRSELEMAGMQEMGSGSVSVIGAKSKCTRMTKASLMNTVQRTTKKENVSDSVTL